MADIFISYSKKHAALTEELARDLEAAGYTTWWDTNLLPDDGFFPEMIRTEIAAAKAVIVIWAEHSVSSKWVYSEASEGDAHGKLLQVRDQALGPRKVPLPFTSGNITLVTDRAKIFAALTRRGIVASNKKLEPAKPAAPPVEPPPARRVEQPKPGLFSRWLAPKAGSSEGPYRPAAASPRQSASGPGSPSVRVKVDALIGNVRDGWFLPGAGKAEWFKDAEFAPEMVVVPAGSFLMGSPPDEPERSDDEGPQHKVTIAKPFAIGRFALTFAEWDAVQQDTDWQGITGRAARQPKDYGPGRGDRPVVDVDWGDAKAYVKWLSRKVGKDYRLPSEAEWEYACRAGTTTPFWWGSSITPEQANYDGNYTYAGGGKKGEYRQKTLPVKSFQPNPWGLYQVHGNVWEWVEDCWEDSYNGAPDDGSVWTAGDSSKSRPAWRLLVWRSLGSARGQAQRERHRGRGLQSEFPRGEVLLVLTPLQPLM